VNHDVTHDSIRLGGISFAARVIEGRIITTTVAVALLLLLSNNKSTKP
jgi:hypothetical protein